MTASSILRMVRRWAWMVLMFGAVAAVTAAVISARLQKVYESRTVALVSPTQVLLPSAATDVGGLPSIDQVVQTYVDLVNTAPTRRRLIADGVPRSDAQLAQSIAVTRHTGTTLIEITADDPDPAVAQRIAKYVVPAFNSSLDELQSSIQNGAPAPATALASPAPADASPAVPANPPQISKLQALVQWEAAVAAPAQVRPLTTLNIAFALLTGLVVGTGFAFLLDRLDQTVKNEDDARTRLAKPVLGTVRILRKRGRQPGTSAVEVVAYDDPKSELAESYRAIRTNLLFSTLEHPLRTLVVTSTLSGEGKTSTACNVAISMAQTGKRVILVDADLRRPSLRRVFDAKDTTSAGLGNLILNDVTEEDAIHPTGLQHLQVVYSGPTPPNPSDLLGSPNMARLIERFQQLADVVIFDTPPIAAVTDAAVLAAQADGVLLVVESGRTSLPRVRRSIAILEGVNANILGVVINKVRKRSGVDYYYHYYYRPHTVESPPTNGGGPKHTEPEDAVAAASVTRG